MRNQAIAISLALTLTGCGVTHQYVHADKTPAQGQADSYDCQQRAYQYSANVGSPSNPFIIADQYNICMQRLYGYALVPR